MKKYIVIKSLRNSKVTFIFLLFMNFSFIFIAINEIANFEKFTYINFALFTLFINFLVLIKTVNMGIDVVKFFYLIFYPFILTTVLTVSITILVIIQLNPSIYLTVEKIENNPNLISIVHIGDFILHQLPLIILLIISYNENLTVVSLFCKEFIYEINDSNDNNNKYKTIVVEKLFFMKLFKLKLETGIFIKETKSKIKEHVYNFKSKNAQIIKFKNFLNKDDYYYDDTTASLKGQKVLKSYSISNKLSINFLITLSLNISFIIWYMISFDFTIQYPMNLRDDLAFLMITIVTIIIHVFVYYYYFIKPVKFFLNKFI